MARRAEAPIRLGAKQREAFADAKVAAAIREFDKIDASRRSAKMMKVLGVAGVFVAGAIAATASVVAPYLAAPTAIAVMSLADSSGILAGISAGLALIGVGRDAHNKRQPKKVQDMYDLVA